MSDGLRISERDRGVVESLLREHVPGVEFWAYSSRVSGRSYDGSDLDLVLRTTDSQPLATHKMLAIAEAFRESNTPFLVDIHDWAGLPEGFHTEIERNHVVLITGIQKERSKQCASR